jgi:hypothetical protein
MKVKITAIIDLPKLDAVQSKGVKITNKNVAEAVYSKYSYTALGKALATQLQLEEDEDDYTTTIRIIRNNPKRTIEDAEDNDENETGINNNYTIDEN